MPPAWNITNEKGEHMQLDFWVYTVHTETIHTSAARSSVVLFWKEQLCSLFTQHPFCSTQECNMPLPCRNTENQMPSFPLIYT